MINFRKHLVYFIIFILSLCLLSGCGIYNQLRNQSKTDIYAIQDFCVFFNNVNSVEIIEEDKYGRTLYSCASLDTLNPGELYDYTSNESVYAYVISQKSDKETVSFYEDDCYILTKSLDTSDDVIENLKMLNDWGKELNDSKMITVANGFSRKNPTNIIYSKRDLKFLLQEKTGTKLKYNEIFSDEFGYSQDEVMIVLRNFYTTGTSKTGYEYFFGDTYVVTLDGDYNLTNYIILTGTPDTWNGQIKKFKQRIGWKVPEYLGIE